MFWGRTCGFTFLNKINSLTLVTKMHLFGMKLIFLMQFGDLPVAGLKLWNIIHQRCFWADFFSYLLSVWNNLSTLILMWNWWFCSTIPCQWICNQGILIFAQFDPGFETQWDPKCTCLLCPLRLPSRSHWSWIWFAFFL